MDALIWLVVMGGTVWVAVDASRLGATRGRLGGGLLDMGPVAWALSCVLFFAIAFPCYIATRRRLVAAQAAEAHPGPVSGSGAPISSPTSRFNATTPPPHAASALHTDPTGLSLGVAQELEDLAQMHRWGRLSDDEFRTAQDRVLRRSGA